MTSLQLTPPMIVTIRSIKTVTSRGRERVQDAKYGFYLHFGMPSFPRKSEIAQGTSIVSVKRTPKIFSEMADEFHKTRGEKIWIKIGEIRYGLTYDGNDVEAETYYYYPKKHLNCEVKRLGYFLDSISTSDIEREYGATTISTTCIAKPKRTGQLEHVGVNVDRLIRTVLSAREYLQAMGKGVKEKADMARRHEDSRQ